MEKHTKKAILVVSFGTSVNETREKTIDRIEADIRNANPDAAIYRAWTSKMIIRKLKERDGVTIHTVKEAMEAMIQDGIRELIVQPTHIINGIENDLMKEDVLARKEAFEKIAFGDPLLTTTEDNVAVLQAVMSEFPALAEDEALVFMGHGTTHYANTVYAALDYTFKDVGYTRTFLGTVEAYPSMESLKKQLRALALKKVILAPFMVVAGDHANNDMSGEDEDSWKSQFVASGNFDRVDCQIAGLGRIAAVEDLYVAHTKAAIDSLGASDDAAAEDTDAKATDDSADDAQADDAAETTADTAEADAE